MNAKADLHVHSKHSNRPSEWLLRQFGAPESFTEPQEIYRLCRARGMDFVTVSDHDSLAGALEIAHLPGTFLSSEVTAAFPEDGCEIHLLVLGVTEAQHARIQRLRGDVYELRDYLREEDVLCSVAHPLFRVNGRLTLAHVEKLVVLFPRFEALNGIHDRLANDLVRRIFGSLTAEALADLAARHRLEPWGERPWIKQLTGGSDDHGGFFIATTHTETPGAATVAEYLDHLRAGAGEPGGETGSSLRLTQSLYGIAYEYYRRRFLPLLGARKDPFAELLRALAQGPRDRAVPPRRRTFALGWRRRPPVETAPPDRATLGFASRASEEALSQLLRTFVLHLRGGRLAESLTAVSSLAPLALAVAPHLVALRAQHKDADLLEQAAARFLGGEARTRGESCAWFVDAFDGTDGPAPAACALVARTAGNGRRVVAITCGRAAAGPSLERKAFAPIAELPVPEAGGLVLRLPPILEVLDHCERERYRDVVVTTPGPVGLLGLAAAKLLGARLVGICDPGLASRVRRWSGSDALGDAAEEYVRWFFGQVDLLHVAGRAAGDRAARHPFDREGLAGSPELARRSA